MLGIDIGNYSLKIVSVDENGQAVGVAHKTLPENLRDGNSTPAVLQEMISAVVEQARIKPKRVALSIPTSSTIIKTIEVDCGLPEEILEGEVQMALADFVPFPLEQIYFDFSRLGNEVAHVNKQQVFVVASRKDTVNNIASTVTLKSIRKKEIEVQAFALGKVLEKIVDNQQDKTYAIIDIGYRTSVISLFSAQRMLFSRDLPVGGQHLTESIARSENLSLDKAEEKKIYRLSSICPNVIGDYLNLLNEQIQLTLETFHVSHQAPPISSAYLTGGGSALSGLLDSFNRYFSTITFEKLPITGNITHTITTDCPSHQVLKQSIATAYGLTLRA